MSNLGNGNLNLSLTYGYKGANCSSLIIQEREDNHFDLLNDYDEVMFSCVEGSGSIAKFVKELSEGKYA